MGRTRVQVDGQLLSELMESTGLKTKRAVVELALRELKRRRQVAELLALRGKVEFWPDYDPEADDDPSDSTDAENRH